MSTTLLLEALHTLHLTGLVLMAGTTVIDTMIYKKFWKVFNEKQGKIRGTDFHRWR